jgi:excisionase family DNA binding protein
MNLKTVSETAEQLRCSTSLVYRLVSEGSLQAVRIGKAKILVPQDRIDRYVSAQLEGSADGT